MTIVDPIAAKTALRIFLRNQRKRLAMEHPEADWMIAEVAREPLARLFPEPTSKVAALYHGLGSEISPRILADQMAEAGWTLALPAVEDAEAGRMVFRAWDPKQALVHDAIGLRSPPPEQPVLEPDLALVAEDDQGVAAYMVGTVDTRAFEARCEAEWWPSRREIYADPRVGDVSPKAWTPDQ